MIGFYYYVLLPIPRQFYNIFRIKKITDISLLQFICKKMLFCLEINYFRDLIESMLRIYCLYMIIFTRPTCLCSRYYLLVQDCLRLIIVTDRFESLPSRLFVFEAFI